MAPSVPAAQTTPDVNDDLYAGLNHIVVKQGEGETARGGVASAMLSHGLESYGIVVVYLRANGIAPPAADGGGGRGGRGGQ
jgi:hypothetical protein